mgnify:CR=1 FL=1
MKVYLQATELTRRVGDKTLFSNINLGIGEGQRVGLVAQNGTGKTTLLNILAGKDAPDGRAEFKPRGPRILQHSRQILQARRDQYPVILFLCKIHR